MSTPKHTGSAAGSALTPTPSEIEGRPCGGGGLERVRHVKRGTEYEVLGEAEAQVATGTKIFDIPTITISDEAIFTVYRCVETGKLFCRITDEFRDGRFVTIAAAPARPETPAGAGAVDLSQETIAAALHATEPVVHPMSLSGVTIPWAELPEARKARYRTFADGILALAATRGAGSGASAPQAGTPRADAAVREEIAALALWLENEAETEDAEQAAAVASGYEDLSQWHAGRADAYRDAAPRVRALAPQPEAASALPAGREEIARIVLATFYAPEEVEREIGRRTGEYIEALHAADQILALTRPAEGLERPPATGAVGRWR